MMSVTKQIEISLGEKQMRDGNMKVMGITEKQKAVR